MWSDDYTPDFKYYKTITVHADETLWDIANSNISEDHYANVNAYMKKLGEQWAELPPVFISSSEKKTGRNEILDYIDSINQSLEA